MKVLVAVKRVIDPNVNIRVCSDGSGVQTSNVKMAMNPFDEIAVEEAVRWKEKKWIDEITVVSIGTESAQETLRQALALGADKGILIQCDKVVEPLNVAKLLKAVVKEYAPDIIIMGKQAIDDDCNQTGQMLAAVLDWPQGTFASQIIFDEKKSHVRVTREVDGGLETLSLRLPCVITTDLRLNEPRYLSLPNIMKAKQKPINVKTPEEYGVDITPRLNILSVKPPPKRKAGVKVQDVQELVDLLRNKEKVI